MNLIDVFNYWLLRSMDKKMFYAAAYGGNVLQVRIDEEGCGAVIAAVLYPRERYSM